jgi:hypothetical protein
LPSGHRSITRNIATVHGIEEQGDTRTLAMELVDGEDLSQRIRCGESLEPVEK